MMKIKMLIGMEGPKVSRVPGDEISVDKEEALRLIKSSFAIALEDRKTTTKKKNIETR